MEALERSLKVVVTVGRILAPAGSLAARGFMLLFVGAIVSGFIIAVAVFGSPKERL